MTNAERFSSPIQGEILQRQICRLGADIEYENTQTSNLTIEEASLKETIVIPPSRSIGIQNYIVTLCSLKVLPLKSAFYAAWLYAFQS